MGDMNLTHEDPFLYIYCWYCLQFGLEYDQLITANDGIKTFYTYTEAPFGDAAFYSTVEPIFYVHTSNVFKAFHKNETLYDISDPVLTEIFFANAISNEVDYFDTDEVKGNDFRWEFYFNRRET
mmetsp:Transcript_27381/g.20529  ORF Transcript_27381/g.20529 Transcript_27381/m.20529 type:complete len:124 (+) Transcript_27381:55-426(+)